MASTSKLSQSRIQDSSKSSNSTKTMEQSTSVNASKSEASSRLLSINRELCTIPYYQGLLTRHDVNPLLTKDGDFLLRIGDHPSVGERYIISVMHNNRVRHFTVSDDGQYWIDTLAFDSITDLINYHQENQTPLLSSSSVVLKNSVHRPKWLLLHEQIEIGEKLGNGQYGAVYKGKLNNESHRNEDVAVKSMRNLNTTREDRIKFLKEARLMRSYKHRNVMQLLGIAVQKEPLMIVMEFCPGGSLHAYLKKAGNGQVTKHYIKERLTFCLEAARGMYYLSAKHNCIHRDIASRNCLLGQGNEVKIADFGLSQQLTVKVFKETQSMRVPVKWLAPETLRAKVYTNETDVWSFGVLIWEIFSDGREPYPGMSNSQVKKHVLAGYRMETPEAVQLVPSLKLLLVQCWDDDHEQRPTFREIRNVLRSIIKETP